MIICWPANGTESRNEVLGYEAQGIGGKHGIASKIQAFIDDPSGYILAFHAARMRQNDAD